MTSCDYSFITLIRDEPLILVFIIHTYNEIDVSLFLLVVFSVPDLDVSRLLYQPGMYNGASTLVSQVAPVVAGEAILSLANRRRIQ